MSYIDTKGLTSDFFEAFKKRLTGLTPPQVEVAFESVRRDLYEMAEAMEAELYDMFGDEE